MDTLTHSLVGLCLGHSFSFKEKQKQREAVFAGILASNIPDLDILYTSITGFGQLGYLVHHRGHTHTLIALPVLALLACFVSSLLTGGRGRWSTPIFMISLSAVFLHLAMDFLNSYGVHPFWPLDNTWIYGDSLFIIEPSIWFALLAYATWSSQYVWSKLIWSFISIAAFAIMWFFAPISLGMKSIMTLIFVGMQAYQAREKGSLKFAWSSLGSLALIFVMCSVWAERRLKQHIELDFPQERVIQLARSPLPGNPFCWRNILVTEMDPQLYIARLGVQSLLPGWMSCELNYDRWAHPKVKRLQPPIESSKGPGEIFWEMEYMDSASELRSLFIENCRANAALRFYRAASWLEDGEQMWMEDLRYMGEGKRSFSAVEISGDECPAFVPDWTPPLEEVLKTPNLLLE